MPRIAAKVATADSTAAIASATASLRAKRTRRAHSINSRETLIRPRRPAPRPRRSERCIPATALPCGNTLAEALILTPLFYYRDGLSAVADGLNSRRRRQRLDLAVPVPHLDPLEAWTLRQQPHGPVTHVLVRRALQLLDRLDMSVLEGVAAI